MASKQTFRQWLDKKVQRNDPVGDFARDVQQDSNAPFGDVGKKMWREYLWGMGACSDALQAFSQAWGKYVSKQRQRER